jgi:phage shock protein PspC (stress-responsive transcriptional regulator)
MMIERYGLYRDPSQGWIAGVAAGLGERFGVATGVIRLVFALFALGGTPVLAIIAYAALAILMPVRVARLEDRFDRRWPRGY